jgi:hypothetical protein
MSYSKYIGMNYEDAIKAGGLLHINKVNGIKTNNLKKFLDSNCCNGNGFLVDCFSENLAKDIIDSLKNIEIKPSEELVVAKDVTLRVAIQLGILDASDGNYMIGGVKRGFTEEEKDLIAKFVYRELIKRECLNRANMDDLVIVNCYYL